MHELFTDHYETLSWRTYRGKDQIIAVKLYIGMIPDSNPQSLFITNIHLSSEMLLKRVVGPESSQFLDDFLVSRWPSPMQQLVKAFPLKPSFLEVNQQLLTPS